MLDTLTFDRPLALLLLPIGAALILFAMRRSRSDLGGSRRIVAVLVRVVVLIAVVLALAGTTWRSDNPSLAVVFALDVSRSLAREEISGAKQWVQQAIDEMGGSDRAGVVLFGSDAVVERMPATRRESGDAPLLFDARPDVNGSDLEAALELAAAILPGDAEKRIVLVSDGLENRGAAFEAAQGLAASGVAVSVLPVGVLGRTRDLRIDTLQAPSSVKEGETFEVRIVLRATGASPEPATAKLRLYRDATFLGSQDVSVVPGRPVVFRALQSLPSGGFYRYRAELVVAGGDADADAVPENDVGHAFVNVVGRPKVLVVEGASGEGDAIAAALRNADLTVTQVAGPSTPASLESLAAFQSIVLANVSALDLSASQGENVRRYVRDLGGGLVMTGGEESFGPGGYFRTPVEEALPVDMDVKNRKYFPTIAMVLVIDKSGSMGSFDDRSSKISLAREAAMLTAALLTPRDEVAVIAFDSAAKVVVPLLRVTDKSAVARDIGTIRSGGGTDIYPGLHQAYELLRSTEAGAKHVILLSDGMSAPGDYPALMAKMKDADVTVSTLAIGSDSDMETMQSIAKLGAGRFYVVDDPQNIPKIFTKETILASRSFLVEEPFRARPARSSEILKGIDVGSAPALYGYVATSPKPRAEVLLSTHRDDPLLAAWRYGLGKAVAFTSDAKPRWARDWLPWQGSGKLWTQMVRWTVATVTDDNLLVSAAVDQGLLEIDAEALDAEGNRLNFLDVSARVVPPAGEPVDLPLAQVGPGRYKGRTAAIAPGTYFVGTTAERGGQAVAQKVTGASLSYPAEFRRSGRDPALLGDLARVAGGALLNSPEQAFRHDLARHPIRHPLWPELAGAALLLFLVDVGVRRVMLPDAFYDRLLAPLRALRHVRPAVAQTHLARLKERRAAARARLDARPPTVGAGGGERRQQELAKGGRGAPSIEAPAAPPAATEEAAPEEPPSFSDRLLEAKKRARK